MDKKGKGIGTKVITVIGVTLIFSGLYWLYKKYYVKPKKENQVLKDAYDNLTFQSGKSIITPSSFPFLDEIVSILNNPEAKQWQLTIAGHTDNEGSKALNTKLSTDRAYSVKNYLVSKGINSSRITAQGFGFDKPIADNKTPEGRAKNRRVEFTISKPDGETLISNS